MSWKSSLTDGPLGKEQLISIEQQQLKLLIGSCSSESYVGEGRKVHAGVN